MKNIFVNNYITDIMENYISKSKSLNDTSKIGILSLKTTSFLAIFFSIIFTIIDFYLYFEYLNLNKNINVIIIITFIFLWFLFNCYIIFMFGYLSLINLKKQIKK